MPALGDQVLHLRKRAVLVHLREENFGDVWVRPQPGARDPLKRDGYWDQVGLEELTPDPQQDPRDEVLRAAHAALRGKNDTWAAGLALLLPGSDPADGDALSEQDQRYDRLEQAAYDLGAEHTKTRRRAWGKAEAGKFQAEIEKRAAAPVPTGRLGGLLTAYRATFAAAQKGMIDVG